MFCGASAAAFSGDNRLLALSDKDGIVRVYHVATRKELKELRGHAGNVRALVFAGSRLVSGGDDRSVRLWNVDTAKEVARGGHTGAVLALTAAADGRRVFSGGADLAVREWDLPAAAK